MCGRTCLTLEPNEILCACEYDGTYTQSRFSKHKQELNKDDDELLTRENVDNYVKPLWRSEFNCGRVYQPSYNIAPTDVTPVIVSGAHFHDNAPETRVVVPMMWSMVPFWHKGDYRKHGLITNNCRLEHMLDSKLYRGPFRHGQRCVVLCEGFYEWQTTKYAKSSERAAYYIYMPQDDAVKIYDKATWPENNVKLLKMAGLFDIWQDENGDKIFSYSVITFESSLIMSWMHHRMPAILETEKQINDWLDYKRVSDDVALSTLRPATALKWHRVANLVNNSRNKSDQCNKPVESTKTHKPAMNKTMLSWLGGTRKQRLTQHVNDKSGEEADCDDNYLNDWSKKRKSESLDGDVKGTEFLLDDVQTKPT